VGASQIYKGNLRHRQKKPLFVLPQNHQNQIPSFETASWSASLGDRALKPKTIKAYFTGLRSHHVNIGYSVTEIEAFHHPTLQRVMVEIRRLQGDNQTRERRPITPYYCNCCTNLINPTLKVLHGMRHFAWHSQDFYEWANSHEVKQWHLTRSSVILLNDSLELTLPSSKTDPFRRGVTLTIAATGDEACARASQVSCTPAGAAVRPRISIHTVTSPEFCEAAALNIEGRYSGHSFRRGAAISARRAGPLRMKFSC